MDERHLRITVHLNNVTDGYQLWSETYDRDLQDVFAHSSRIYRQISVEMREKTQMEVEDAFVDVFAEDESLFDLFGYDKDGNPKRA